MKVLKTLAMLALLALMAACAQPARLDAMKVTAIPDVVVPDGFFLRKAILINNVHGGEPTNPLWTSQVGNVEFRAALESSLEGFGLLAPPSAGTYDLTATLIKLDQPLMGIDMTVTTSANYLLKNRATNAEALNRTITLPYTATFGSALLGVERLRVANEGSIKTNLEQLIRDLLSLQPPAP